MIFIVDSFKQKITIENKVKTKLCQKFAIISERKFGKTDM